jgi:hypothetical protein
VWITDYAAVELDRDTTTFGSRNKSKLGELDARRAVDGFILQQVLEAPSRGLERTRALRERASYGKEKQKSLDARR